VILSNPKNKHSGPAPIKKIKNKRTLNLQFKILHTFNHQKENVITKMAFELKGQS
jgi:hypothetical protein